MLCTNSVPVLAAKCLMTNIENTFAMILMYVNKSIVVLVLQEIVSHEPTHATECARDGELN